MSPPSVAFAQGVVEGGGETFVRYHWQRNDDENRVEPKLGYVRDFEPWGWIVGTGIYSADVQAEIRSLTLSLWTISVVISLIIIALLSGNALLSLRGEKRRRNAEEKLSQSRERYRALVEAANEGVLLVVDGRITNVNRTALTILGFEHQSLHPCAARIFQRSFQPRVPVMNSTSTCCKESATTKPTPSALSTRVRTHRCRRAAGTGSHRGLDADGSRGNGDEFGESSTSSPWPLRRLGQASAITNRAGAFGAKGRGYVAGNHGLPNATAGTDPNRGYYLDLAWTRFTAPVHPPRSADIDCHLGRDSALTFTPKRPWALPRRAAPQSYRLVATRLNRPLVRSEYGAEAITRQSSRVVRGLLIWCN